MELKTKLNHKEDIYTTCLRWELMTNIKLSSSLPPKNYPMELIPHNTMLPQKEIAYIKQQSKTLIY